MITQERLLDAFVQLADTLVDDFDVIDFLHTVAEISVELLESDACGLMLADQRGTLQVVASSSEESRLLELFELQHDEGPCLDCYQLGSAVVNLAPEAAEERWPAFGAAVRRAGFTSVHAIPLRLRDQVIGAMNLFVARPGGLSAPDLALARAIADIATIGLLQQRVIQEQQLLAEQLQGALNSRVIIEQAKGVLAERHALRADSAFGLLRGYARRTGQTLLGVATQVIEGSLDTATLARALG